MLHSINYCTCVFLKFNVAKCNLGKVNLEAMLVSKVLLLFACQFVLWSCLLFSACTMTTRRTNNSLAARFDGEHSSSDTLLQAESSGPSSVSSVANSAPQTSSTVSAPVVAAGVHDPALIAAIVDAV